MSVSTALDGLKTILEANGYTVMTTGDEYRDAHCTVKQTHVVPVYQENATWHNGIFRVVLMDKIKPRDRHVSEKTAAARVEAVIKALKDGYTAFAVQLIIDGASTSEESGFRVTEMEITAIYAV